MLDGGIDRDDIGQQDRRDEFHGVDRNGRHRALRDAAGDDPTGNIHLRQNPSAEDVAIGIDIGRARNNP